MTATFIVSIVVGVGSLSLAYLFGGTGAILAAVFVGPIFTLSLIGLTIGIFLSFVDVDELKDSWG